MSKEKKMYVIQCDNGLFFGGFAGEGLRGEIWVEGLAGSKAYLSASMAAYIKKSINVEGVLGVSVREVTLGVIVDV